MLKGPRLEQQGTRKSVQGGVSIDRPACKSGSWLGVWISRVFRTSLTAKGGSVWALCTNCVFLLNSAGQRGLAGRAPSKDPGLWSSPGLPWAETSYMCCYILLREGEECGLLTPSWEGKSLRKPTGRFLQAPPVSFPLKIQLCILTALL